MKKILIILIAFFVFIKNINAETIYGEYRKVSDFGNYNSDTLKIDNYKLYNTYENKYTNMGYMLENDEYIKDENDSIEDYVIVNDDLYSDEYINIDYNTKSSFRINFNNLSDLKINEIEIYKNNKLMGYGFTNDDREGLNYLYDRNYETYLDCSTKNYISINMYYNYDIEDITLIIYTKEPNDYSIKLGVLNENKEITLHNSKSNKHIITFNYIDNPLIDKKINYEYKGIRTLYKYYKEENILLNNYIKTGDNILLDDYIEVSDYYIRDKLVLKDEIIIKNYNTKITDFIEYSTNNVNINCNIDYLINGIYNCEFILNDIRVNKEVLVDIENNNITLENEEKNVYNSLENQEQNNSQKKYKINKKKILSNKKTPNTKETTKIITTKKVKEIKKDIKELEKENKIINIVKYIIIFNLILIEIILFLKKRKRNNVETI